MTKTKKILLILLIAIIILIAVYFVFFKKNKSENENNVDINVENSQSKNEKTIEEPVVLTPTTKTETIPEEVLPEGTDRFIVQKNITNEEIADSLLQAGFIKDSKSFTEILNKEKNQVSSGAYKLSKEMTESQINKVLHGNPYMKWVVIKEGLRKEEIATILADTFNWSSKQKNDWITKDTAVSKEYIEGVYYPDTYLIPVTEEPSLMAKRLISKFNEKFVSYLPKFTEKNIKWARALTLASIVQREASNNADIPLIAGILWNRLNQNMFLGVDATLQYARGDIGNGWWAPITISEKESDSPFNTYKYKGLPPHPISNPGIPAIEAVLNPTETDCLYYLHDKNRVTHCSATYEEHQKNIQKYLVDSTN
ncbi:MAG TPA: endolytic transglycosylase MltG [Candidatus Paceibacterota bacterium]|nr:endolytic transglycosylase MltG [Candidatus Paceibacterota bacterium]HPT18113.1 endolytic transglycosylase MltG [Candidatus Paceibacterota bacterium]